MIESTRNYFYTLPTIFSYDDVIYNFCGLALRSSIIFTIFFLKYIILVINKYITHFTDVEFIHAFVMYI